MEFKKFLELGVRPAEGVSLLKFLINIRKADEKNVLSIKELFESHNYDISVVQGSFYKIFTKNEKEIAELSAILTEIDALNMQEVFQANLRYECFTKNFLAKIDFCRVNNLPYLYEEDKIFIKELFSNKDFGEYTRSIPLNEVKTTMDLNNEPSLDEEDLMVKKEILSTLVAINEVNGNDFGFLIAAIIANIDKVILKDNKMYKTLGTRHLIEDALQDINITPEIHYELEEKVLSAFTDLQEIKRGVA